MSILTPRTVGTHHHRCPSWTMLLILGPLLYFVASAAKHPFLLIITGRLPIYVLTGKLFTEPFNIIHAGSALDQPTIGKWMLWFSVLTTLSMPLILLARWLNYRSTTPRYWGFAIPVLAIGALLVSVVILPVCMLVQYVHWMGFTPKRIFGLSFGLAALVLLVWFLHWTLRRPTSSGGDNSSQRPEPTTQ